MDEPTAAEGAGGRAALAAAEPARMESQYFGAAGAQALLRLVETAPAVNRRYQFFVWLQSHVHALLPHPLAVCGAYQRGRRHVHFEVFNSIQVPQALIDAFGGAESAPMAWLSRRWVEGQGRPFVLELDAAAARSLGADGAGLREIGIARLLVHGVARPERAHEIETLFAFATEGPHGDAAQLRALELLMPHLHATYLRADGVERELGGRASRAEMMAERPAAALSTRERQILHWVREGKTNHAIGAELGISGWTVKNHVQRILAKLGAANRAHAVAMAMKAGLLSPVLPGRAAATDADDPNGS